MARPIIEVTDLSKSYTIGERESYGSLRDEIMQALASPFRKKGGNGGADSVWALKDVSFEVEEGTVLGIIGKNGAGKSTLLKVLSRITEPTSGRITMQGRVASLLEVGTGFHPELTGRENIFLNGALLGMTSAEIRAKFDEIVAFSEIEKFLDTPVKRFSSGMYMRLAFAVAAHLEPEILVVDEVLAVGDAAFQKKCLGKIGDVAKGGRTVLFVSHNMNAVEQLCSKALFLDRGNVRGFSDDVPAVIKEYLFGRNNDADPSEWANSGAQFDNSWFRPLKFFISDEHGEKQMMPLGNNAEIFVQLETEIKELDTALTIGYAIYNEDGSLMYWSYQTDEAEERQPVLHKGRCVLRSRIPKRFLNEGVYRIELLGSLHFREWLLKPGAGPTIYLTLRGGLSDSAFWMARRPGLLAPVLQWRLVK